MEGSGSRFYRGWSEDTDLVSFTVALKESDLYVRATRNLRKKAFKALARYREMIERYAESQPEFLTALHSIEIGPDAPEIVRVMEEASRKAGVGPMAAVAGALAEFVGRELMVNSREVIVENGGDIFLKTLKERAIGVYAGEESPFTGRLAIEVDPGQTPLGICTSSGNIGHSLSFGTSDATVVLSRSTALADAAATSIGNLVIDAASIPYAIEFARTIDGVEGVVVLKDDRVGAWGEVKLVSLERAQT